MRLKIMCPICFSEKEHKNGETINLEFEELVSTEINDKPYYTLTCSKGHSFTIFIQVPKYELLFDMGLSAFLNGYYREAVLDYAAAIERFHEFCICSFLWKQGISQESFNIMWKEVSKQSERQYGEFLALYLYEKKTPPRLQTDKWIKFRNDITHKGRFPSKEETYDYARYVAEYITDIVGDLKEDICFSSETMYTVLNGSVKDCHTAMGYNSPTALWLIIAGNSFDEAVTVFKNNYKNLYE